MSEDTLNDRLRRAAEMARQRAANAGEPTRQDPPKAPNPQTSHTPNPQPFTAPRPVHSAPAAQQPASTASPKSAPSGAPDTAPKIREAYDPSPNVPQVEEFVVEKPRRKNNKWLWILLGVLLVGAGAGLALLFQSMQHNGEIEQLKHEQEQLELANQQLQLSNEYDNLNNEFAQYENQTVLLANDSIVQKYAAAKAQVEKLLQELKEQKSDKSAEQIAALRKEIESLKGILRTYIEQINELKQQNQQLTAENQEVKAQNQQLSQTVENVQGQNRQLNERMTLAEKLNVTGVSLQALNKKGKNEKNVTKAKQLRVSFTVAPNNSTPVGQKVFYLRIINPEGDLLGNSGSFSFEGSSVSCTAMKSIEYTGEEQHDQFYWNVTSTLTPGTYKVELFTDGYRVCSRSFELAKK